MWNVKERRGVRIRPLAFAALLPISMLALLSVSACDRSSASQPRLGYHLVWTTKLDQNVDSSEVVALDAITLHGERRSIVLALAGNNDSDCQPANPVRLATTYAFEATTGKLLWRMSTRGRSRCTTSSPAVSGGWVYSPGLDGKIHRYSLLTGREYRGHGWPEPFTLSPNFEKASSPLRVDGRYLYVTTSGYTGRPGRYQGHLVTIDLATGSESVWNSLCSNITTLINPDPRSPEYCPFTGSGIWSRSGVEVDPENGNIVLVTGNGPWNGRTNWGDSLIELSRDGRHLLGSFTPANQAYLDHNDLDLGSTSPVMLPAVRWQGHVVHLAIQAGKGPSGGRGGPAVVLLLDRTLWAGRPGQLGGEVATTQTPDGCEVLTAPAVWMNEDGQPFVIYADDCAVAEYRVRTPSSSTPRLSMVWQFSTNQEAYTTPVVSGNILFIAHAGAVVAYDPKDGRELWSSASPGSGGSIGLVHWEYPAVSGDMLFMTDERARLYAYRRNQ